MVMDSIWDWPVGVWTGILLPCLGLLLLLLLGSVLHWRGWRTYWHMWRLPGLTGLPIIGIPWTICVLTYKDMLPFGTKVFERFRLMTFNLLGMPVVIMKDPEDIKYLLENTANIKKGFEYNCFRPWLREGLLVSHGLKWYERRKLLTPAFHFEILQSSLPGLWTQSQVFVRKLLASSGRGSPADIEDTVRLYTLDVICETAMGIELNAQENRGEEYVAALKRATDVVLKRALHIWLQAEWLFKLTAGGRAHCRDLKVLHRFSQGVIDSKRRDFRAKTNNKNEVGRKAFLDSLLELGAEGAGGQLSPLDIREEVDTFMFEGHDTTSSAIIFALYLLSIHPTVQEKAATEQSQIFEDDGDREPTIKDLQAMVYLEMVIKETLRLYPSVPYFSRTLTKDIRLKDGKVIPRGANAGVSVYHVHRNPDFWESPEEFRPERFESRSRAERHPFAYLAFSAGPRNCIGQKFAMLELKTTLSGVLRWCRLGPVQQEICLEPVVILKNYKPIRIQILPRREDLLESSAGDTEGDRL